jgi:hypothetical protein
MPIEIAALAATVVSSFLLPYVKLGAKKLAEEVTEQTSSAAADHVTRTSSALWDRVRGIFTDEKEKTTLELFEADPDGLAATVERVLAEKLRSDETLAAELSELVEAQSPDGSGTGAQIMNATIAGIIDLRSAKIEGGTFTAVNVGADRGGQAPSRPSGPETSKPGG